MLCFIFVFEINVDQLICGTKRFFYSFCVIYAPWRVWKNVLCFLTIMVRVGQDIYHFMAIDMGV